MIYDLHIFVCTNQRAPGEKRSCGEVHGLELVAEFKKQLKDSAATQGASLSVRANRCGCLGICDFGPTVAIYPEGIFYAGVSKSDVPEIVKAHLNKSGPVERLLLRNKNEPPAGLVQDAGLGLISNLEIFEAFRTQLAKDFQAAGFDTDFVNELHPDLPRVMSSIGAAVRGAAGESAKISRLLNRVDISDRQLKEQMQRAEGGSLDDALPELIIKRILQKVVLRKKFSA